VSRHPSSKHAARMFYALCLASAMTAFCLNSQGQTIDLSRAVGSCRPSGAASMATMRVAGLEFPAAFTPDGSPRAFWDIPLHLDLSQMAALRLRLYVLNPGLASQYNAYIRAGNTWYAAEFAPSASGRWEEIILPKTRFMPEGAPGSWQLSTMLRLAAWRGGSGNLAIYAAEIEFMRPNLSIAVLRSGSDKAAAAESYSYARHLGEALYEQGIYPAVFEEADSTLSLLLPYRMLFFPTPEAAGSPQVSTVVSYLRRGGKAAVFYTLPPPLTVQMGFPSGKFARAAQTPGGLAAVQPDQGRLPGAAPFRQQSTAFVAVNPAAFPSSLAVAAWWLDSSGAATGWPAIVESAQGFWMTHVYLHQDPRAGSRVMAALADRIVPEADRQGAAALLRRAEIAYAFAPASQRPHAAALALARARQALASANFTAVGDDARNCQEILLGAETPATAARPGEFRAGWMRRPQGLPGKSWEETVSILAQSGINAIFPNFLSPAVATYPSRLVPSGGTDWVAPCLTACRRYGIQLHAWVSCLGVEDAPAIQLRTWRQQGRLQVNARQEPLGWLCPSHPENRALVTRMTAEIARLYALDGVHLDLIRFPQSDSCFCPNCRKAFAADGHLLSAWPDAVLRPGPDRLRWEQFRRQQISSLTAETASAVRAARPGIAVSAAVYPDWQNARTAVGQDWVPWCRNGIIDFVCPMNYRPSSALFAGDLQRQSQQLGGVNRLVPGIGASSQRLSAEELARQIAVARQAQAPGFILFELGPREVLDVLPRLTP